MTDIYEILAKLSVLHKHTKEESFKLRAYVRYLEEDQSVNRKAWPSNELKKELRNDFEEKYRR